MQRKDLKPGDCYVGLYKGNALVVAASKPHDLPPGWHFAVVNIGSVAPENRDREVVILEHYSTHPMPTPRVDLKLTRQAALAANFGKPPKPALVDGLTPDECLRRYTLAQRAENAVYGDGTIQFTHENTQYTLTSRQRICAQALWSHDVRKKVATSDAADAERERTQVVVQRDYWEVD